jgi:hypothetical protein
MGLLASDNRTDGGIQMPVLVVIFPRRFACPRRVRTVPNVINIEREGGGGGCPTGAGRRRRRHRDKAAEGDEEDVTLATYV